MMKKVRIREWGGPAEYILDDDEREGFQQELSRTAPWRTLRGIIDFITGRDRHYPPGIAPDAEIVVSYPGGRTRTFTLHARVVLRDTRSGRTRQFYMGAVLLEWLK